MITDRYYEESQALVLLHKKALSAVGALKCFDGELSQSRGQHSMFG